MNTDNSCNIFEDKEININCPHCNEQIFIMLSEINCNVFRHGIYKETFQQMDPHTPKEDCDYLANNNLIIGCGKPFCILVQKSTGKFVGYDCGYI